jgi:uncharacterized protein YbbK (DUF523 family)
MEKILVSACLMGNPVRYDGQHRLADSEILRRWQREGRLVTVCPELAGGFSVPRRAAEIVSGLGAQVLTGHAQVIDSDANDVSAGFIRGAELALESAQRNAVRIAILKEGSPSCGSTRIYNGEFSSTTIAGHGVTTALLIRHGVRVFSEHQLTQAESYLHGLEKAALQTP